MNQNQKINNSVFIGPPISIETYAKNAGLSVATVRGQIQKGYLPTIKIGKYNMVNTYQLAADCIRSNQEQ